MGVLLKMFLAAAGWVSAGIAGWNILDKFVPDKLPAGVGPLSNTTDASGKINWIKVGFLVVVGAIAIVFVRWLAKKMNISILK